MKLCEYCVEHVLEKNDCWDYHHASYASLEASSGDGLEHGKDISRLPVQQKQHCLFCWTLHNDIKNIAPGLKKLERAGAWPVYRWNIRSLARIRESFETVVVTFRYVPPADEAKEDDVEEVELPTRTFFLFPEDDLSPLLSPHQLGISTDPKINGGYQIRSWVETCDTTHIDCMKRRKSTPKAHRFVPTRLLDISGLPDTPIRLIETATTSVHGPYCSLSHCWGLIKFVELRDENRTKFMQEGIPWYRFTKNFQDAIEVARFLEVGYIWIDSLCIIQRSEEDWKHEASRMHLVYRNSYCNIAIADSADSTGGAFRVRNPDAVMPARYQPRENSPLFGKKAWRVVPENLWDSGLLQTFLYARGWVFQERMLSPRILHFANNQVFWDCPSLSACETLPAGLPQPTDNAAGPDRHWRGRLQEPEGRHEPLAGANDQSLASFWKVAVLKYTSCNLTMGKDKLIAMWGIAKLIRDELGVEYGEGLWEENLEDQLAWRVEECKLTVRPSESTEWNLERKIPSWSWASMDGVILTPDRLTDQKHFTVKDHYGQRLTFDLVGVKRSFRPGVRPIEAPPPLQSRGMSDSGAELQRRNKELRRDPIDTHDNRVDIRIHSPEKVDRDAEPRFHSKSIRIQGHVGRGRLEWEELKKGWVVQLDDETVNVGLEAFPDTIPDLDNPTDHFPYFVVLAAKQVIGAQHADFTFKPTTHKHPQISDDASTAENDHAGEYFEVSGHGIMLKDVGNHHFHRTGAFRFENVSNETFVNLQRTHDWELFSSDIYHSKRGRKIWLD
ncbi:HET-domain-containing protein [Dothidotthia symphoricarpi CBS 119687]|uniref:HET-domain-containing protein n=1 Tax=Dothidotthia symphoricarpi CBS 119687 TaxID=1392245 RepID=A0A6A6ANM6_9PLEO|nr:HET-domain-containing protein [Dothidotthia symphoricarpi CBS 119687]KAF2132544.1 HET-domain-containing protein [Dothidotthia symphoricarpi CBS 119687]